MQIDKIINRIKQNCPDTNIFKVGSSQARVAGAAEFDIVEDDQRLAVPSMFVLLAPGMVSDIEYRPSFQCEFKESCYVMVVLNAQRDRRGQTPQQQIHDIKWWLVSVLEGWCPDSDNWSGLFLEDDTPWRTSPARYYHYFTFSQFMTIDEAIFTHIVDPENEISDLRSVQGDIDIVDSVPPVIPQVNVAGLYPTIVTLSGAGTDVVNGTYTHVNGEYVIGSVARPIYRKDIYRIEWNTNTEQWEIRDMRNVYYVSTDINLFPPEDNWTSINGAVPVPALQEE